jgi:hypothetical protein
MDVVLALVLFLGSFLLAYFIWKKNRSQDQKALDEEIDCDFIEEFGLDKSQEGDLSAESMEKVIDWLENDLKVDSPNPTERRIDKVEDIV